MPDTRSHRGAHPEDATLFARERWPALQNATADLCWLLDRGYAMRSSVALVGDRHALTDRQRIAIARCACSQAQAERRRAHELAAAALAGGELWIDGYNLLISVEAALSGGVILKGRDGCYRDLASLHGTYRTVSETEPALRLIGEALAGWDVRECRWLLDRPVSNSGRLKTRILELAAARGWRWEVQLEFSPDKLLSDSPAIVASSDSVVLDRCARWSNVAREIIARTHPRGMGCAAGLTCRLQLPDHLRQFAQRFDLEKPPLGLRRLLDVLRRPQEMIRHMHPGTAQGEHRQDVGLQRVADHQKIRGGDAVAAKNPRIGALVFLGNDLDLREVRRKARLRELPLLVAQVALRDQQQPVFRGEQRKRFRRAFEEIDRVGQHFLA
jgi:hypothetical protein